jgi:hypothetical protein
MHFFAKDHLYELLMDLEKKILSHFEKGLNLTLEIEKKTNVQHIMGPAYYCVKQNTVSTLALICSSSAFCCRHAVVVSCFALPSPLYNSFFGMTFVIKEKYQSIYYYV